MENLGIKIAKELSQKDNHRDKSKEEQLKEIMLQIAKIDVLMDDDYISSLVRNNDDVRNNIKNIIVKLVSVLA